MLSAALITHRRAALAVLERMPRGPALPAALTAVTGDPAVDGAVGLSTCNRFELYLDGTGPVDRAALVDRLHALTGVDRADLGGALELLAEEDAVHHLFSVAAGLESRLVGEDEILGQVRAAARQAERDGTATAALQELFRWAVRTGRRARRVAGLAEGRISLALRAVDVLDERLHPLHGRTVLVLGAGQMAARVVEALRRAEAWPVLLVRRPDAVPAGDVPVLGLEALPVALGRADAVLCATSAPTPLLTAEVLHRAAVRRAGRPLVVIDLAVPRNVEAAAQGLAGIHLLDLDALTEGPEEPAFAAAARRAAAVVSGETRAYGAREERSAAGPLIEQVLRHGEAVRRAELARAARLAPGADPQILDELSARIVAKLLHAPITAVREHAGAGDDGLAVLIAATLTGNVGTALSAARTRCTGPSAHRSPGSAA